MEISKLTKLFRETMEVDPLVPVYRQLLSDRDHARSMVLSMLGEFSENPALLSDESSRRLLANLFLLCGMLRISEAWPLVLKVVVSEPFTAQAGTESWLCNDLSRLFGTIAPDNATVAAKAIILDAATPMPCREQLILAMIFRWLSNYDSDRIFSDFISDLMAKLPSGETSFEVAMAIIISAVAPGGAKVRPQVMAFHEANAGTLGDQLSEKNLRNFFDLGHQRIKGMLRGNYLGVYGEPEAEITRMLTYKPEEESNSQSGRTLPPITRDRPKVGRNDPCPCGSGKKYKHCCGR